MILIIISVSPVQRLGRWDLQKPQTGLDQIHVLWCEGCDSGFPNVNTLKHPNVKKKVLHLVPETIWTPEGTLSREGAGVLW